MNRDSAISGEFFEPISAVCTNHARQRMDLRGVRRDTVKEAIHYGRVVFRRNAVVHIVGKKEVTKYRRHGIDISGAQGVHVVCDSHSHTILTVYRNQELRRAR